MVKEEYVPLVRLMMVKEKELPYTGERVNNAGKVAELARQILEGADREYMLVLSVNSKGKPLAMEIVSIGSVNEAPAVPREIFKHAILTNAVGIILIHNHLSGDCTPSRADQLTTKRMEEVGELVGIPVEDHIILGEGYYSFREEKVLID